MRSAQLAPPWYVHPAAEPQEWAWLANQRREVSFAVMNVHDGPGQDGDAYYPAALAELQNIQLLGYVPVSYGERSVAEVARDIAAWRTFYGMTGIMLDELPTSPQSLARCGEYAAAAREAGVSFLVANPGVFPTSEHLDLLDVTCVFEGTAATYTDFEHPDWARDVPPSRLWHLVYGCEPEQIDAVTSGAIERGAGHVFATDRSLPNPWLGLPRVLSAELRFELQPAQQ